MYQSEQRWIPLHEFRSLPPETKRDAILFESEDQWREFQRLRDLPTQPGGISMSGKPEAYTGVPVPALLPHQTHAWNKKWTGAGYFLPSGNKWFHDQCSPGIPKEALKFYNEEDWNKFKYMNEKPDISTAAYQTQK
ncbi:hypothetical protein KUTeg_008953 [Tegillarca granosa]|uniref:Uncharacterized protein n=1 Tax=Tegillarca granosa TaxID=220873 RepID=A0ABQ9FAM1_TEGGR|nr:hypothetical protein KUTeg_008953 [Tegillarca granosa]